MSEVASAMAEAANELLAGLSPDQQARARWPFPSDDERRRWYYTPTDHGGLALSEMDGAQHRLVHRLLATGLSEPGYVTMALILGQDNILDRLEGFVVDFGRARGRDPLLYWVSIFGSPGQDRPWGWRFGGHHLSLHFTIVDGIVRSATPNFMGTDPASSPLLGPHLHRPLGGAEDLGRELARSFSPEQSSVGLVAPVAPTDIISSNRADLTEGDRPLPLTEIWRGRFEQQIQQQLVDMDQRTSEDLGLTDQHLDALAFSRSPKGVAAGDLRADQQEILRALLMTYIGRIHDDLADAEMAKFDGPGLDELHFLWAGGLEVGRPHYYRIQGRDLLVEYDNAQRQGNHAHSVWRDLTNDFGGDPLAQHYVSGHQH